ncbi:hypothetical protein FACS1894198_3950 [Clostridia bacterium]|nr:hypothetical protein FACS1894198_3950 [Clostridia bacterium]
MGLNNVGMKEIKNSNNAIEGIKWIVERLEEKEEFDCWVDRGTPCPNKRMPCPNKASCGVRW